MPEGFLFPIEIDFPVGEHWLGPN